MSKYKGWSKSGSPMSYLDWSCLCRRWKWEWLASNLLWIFCPPPQLLFEFESCCYVKLGLAILKLPSVQFKIGIKHFCVMWNVYRYKLSWRQFDLNCYWPKMIFVQYADVEAWIWDAYQNENEEKDGSLWSLLGGIFSPVTQGVVQIQLQFVRYMTVRMGTFISYRDGHFVDYSASVQRFGPLILRVLLLAFKIDGKRRLVSTTSSWPYDVAWAFSTEIFFVCLYWIWEGKSATMMEDTDGKINTHRLCLFWR